MAPTTIRVEPLTAEAYAPYGWVFGEQPEPGRRDWIESDNVRFWHEHDFLTGQGGVTEFVWVTYKPREPVVTRVEAHRLTEQAIVPVSGHPILHLVAPPNDDPLAAGIVPDLSRAKAFLMDGTKGICMRPGTWHTHFGLGHNLHLLVTRRSTTDDILDHIHDGAEMGETVFADIEPIRLDASALGIEAVSA